VQGTVAITDKGWYEQLLAHPELVEVNFWTPSARRAFRESEGAPFLFKLKAPHNAICGFGFFSRYTQLPDWLAWDCFGIGNGCTSLGEFRNRLRKLRRSSGYKGDTSEPRIGCILILAPVFFPEEQWIRQPTDWPATTQSYKRYDLQTGEGRRVWDECLARAEGRSEVVASVSDESKRYGEPVLVKPRLGQGTFRVAVTEAYDWGCAVTGEHSLPALDAAHIQPYGEGGPHDVSNGVLLRADLHRLFDLGYVTISPDLNLVVSRALKSDYDNGHTYYPMHGQPIHVPGSESERPAGEFVGWHNENVFRG